MDAPVQWQGIKNAVRRTQEERLQRQRLHSNARAGAQAQSAGRQPVLTGAELEVGQHDGDLRTGDDEDDEHLAGGEQEGRGGRAVQSTVE